jgi:hypothetical protein
LDLERAGFNPDVEAQEFTMPGLVKAIAEFAATRATPKKIIR